MDALRLAFALIRIPRLFISLFLLPLLFSMGLVYAQLIATGVFLKTATLNSDEVEETYQNNTAASAAWGRRLVYGTGDALPPLIICRWVEEAGADGRTFEAPPSPECRPSKLDVAVRTRSPAAENVESYRKVFEGNVERIHLCKTCHPDIIISLESGKPRAESYSFQSLIILGLTRFNADIHEQHRNAWKQFEQLLSLFGDIYFQPPGFRKQVKLQDLTKSSAFVANVAILIVLALWLALKAHRKVLEYFARNGALLPMVASIGKSTFYSAIWILTLIRVTAFLGAAVPISYFEFKDLINQEDLTMFWDNRQLELALWLLALCAGFALAAVIASVADLKQRHHLHTALYRFLPLLIASLGVVAWLVSFLVNSPATTAFRNFLAATPILGLTPVLVAPIFTPQHSVLIVHAALSLFILSWLLRNNSRWFAAHLDQL